ncbi:MAG: hypothetical protein ABJG15_09145 [Hyphomonadaceae bacterium]
MSKEVESTVSASVFFNFDWFAESIADLGYSFFYFKIVPKAELPSLCVPKENAAEISEALISIANRAKLGLSVKINADGKTITTLSEIRAIILENPVTQLRFSDGTRTLSIKLEQWSFEGSSLVAPCANLITKEINLEAPSAKLFFGVPGRNLRELFDAPLSDQCTLDIDAVYSWVNPNDENWKMQFEEHINDAEASNHRLSTRGLTTRRKLKRRSVSFENGEGLKYSLRSLFKFAPWIRHIYIVSNCPPPSWLDESHQKITWVYHETIMSLDNLPTFNPNAVDSAIHKIPNLGDHYLYLQDTIFLTKPTEKSDFFTPAGLAMIRLTLDGLVHGDLRERDPDFLNAARNSQRLIIEEFGQVPTKLHNYSPLSVVRSVAATCEQNFAKAYQSTRARRFSSIDDISPRAFLYPHFALMSGMATQDDDTSLVLDPQFQHIQTFDQFPERIFTGDTKGLPLCLSIESIIDSERMLNWEQVVTRFVRLTFIEASPLEK